MKLSKKSRYGLAALIDLSVHSKHGHVALNSIAERNAISPQYLEQVFASLRRAGIVRSVKGAQGGYLLNRDSDKITVGEILEALDGTYLIDSESVSDSGSYGRISATIQSLVIDQVNAQLDNILQNLTLAELEEDYLDKNQYGQDMYYI